MSNNTASVARTNEVTETLEHLDPVTLLLDRNITERDADATLVASVREHGVLTPARGVRTEDGQVRLRYGYRRAAACMATGRLLPVIVAEATGQADDPEAAAAALDRLAEQWAENEHRKGLSATDKVSAVAQMSLLGLSSDQIAARTHTSPTYAAAAVSVARSEMARHALSKTPDLDLTQVAALAEFEDDLDAANRLYAAAQNGPGRFAHTLASERDARTRAEARTQLFAVLAERAVPVIDAPDYDAQAVRLNQIRHDGAMVTPAEHATCPGRAAFVETEWTTQDLPEGYDLSALEEEQPAPAEEPAADGGEDDEHDADEEGEEEDDEGGPTYRPSVRVWRVRWACTDPEAYGHTVPSRASTRPALTGSEQDQQSAAEAARAERREVRENNAAWRLAEPVRRDFIRTLLTRKTAPKSAAAFIATVAARHTTALTHHSASSVTADLLGASALGGGYTAQAAPLVALGKASEARALVIALGTCLGACEAMTDVNDWRRQAGTTGLLLRTLVTWGYERSDVERLACGEQPVAVAGEEVDAVTHDDQPDDAA